MSALQVTLTRIWKGSFYPKDLPDRETLHYYGRHFSTVEINHTFYRMPAESVLANWAEAVGAGFRFALKLNQKITHILKLRNCESALRAFLQTASVLGAEQKLGPVLIQLPPSFRADAGVLEEFLKLQPPAFRFAFEVRHASWHTEQTYALLRAHNTALCLAETDQGSPPQVLTADFAYVRLRKGEYTPAELVTWRRRCDEWVRQGADVYVYCKHEEAGKGAAYARALLDSAAPGP